MSVRAKQIRSTFDELINKCFSGGLRIINRFFNPPISNYTTNVLSNVKTLDNDFDKSYKNCVYMNFEGGISGMIILLIPQDKEKEIAFALLNGFTGLSADFIKTEKQEQEILKEASNIIFCNILGSFSNLTLHYTNYLPPVYSNVESVNQALRYFINYTSVEFCFEIEHLQTKATILLVLKHARAFERYIEPYIENYQNRQ
jgi:chemotaxis protein CheY-P-specific phosphatase CheC